MPRGSNDAYYYANQIPSQRSTTLNHLASDRRDKSAAVSPNTTQEFRSPRMDEHAASVNANDWDAKHRGYIPQQSGDFVDPFSRRVLVRSPQQGAAPVQATSYQQEQMNASRRRSSDRSSISSTTSGPLCSPPVDRPIMALPGTMSSRSGTEMYRDERQGRRTDALEQLSANEGHRKSSLARRCKTAVRDALSSSYPGGEEMVYIEESHWTDDS